MKKVIEKKNSTDDTINKKVRIWDGWNKISSSKSKIVDKKRVSNKKKTAPSARIEYKNPLSKEKLEVIDKKGINKKFEEKYRRHITKNDSVRIPRICFYSGLVLEDDYFIAYLPQKVYLSRAIKQSSYRCKNCSGPVRPSIINKELIFCEMCSHKGVCVCGRKESPKDLKRIKGIAGLFCPSCFYSKKNVCFVQHQCPKHQPTSCVGIVNRLCLKTC